MSESLVCLLAIVLIAIAFAVLTILAHRTNPRAKQTFTLGLTLTMAILGLLWWCTSPSFGVLPITSKILSAGVFALLALFYSRCVLQSRSVWRWAGALAAIILLAVALVIDFMADARTRDIAITLAIIVLGTNFLGHLIRARINQMLLRAPSGLKEEAKVAATLSLIKENPNLATSDALDTLTTDIIVTQKDVATVVKAILQLLSMSPDTTATIDINVKVAAKMHDLIYVARIAKAFKDITQEKLSITVNETDIAFSIQNTLSTQAIEDLSRALYGLAVDSVEVSDEQINTRFRKR